MLITTLIPIYKTHFIEDLINCLHAQTEQRFSVIFSDDSPSQDVAEILADIHTDEPIRFAYEVIPGPRLGPASNCYHLFTAWNKRSPYLHYLLDDDLIAPAFYQQHLQVLEQTGASLCISARNVVNETGQELQAAQAPAWLTAHAGPQQIGFATAVQHILPPCNNGLGELSCATIRGASMVQHIKRGLRQLPYYGLNDLGIFLELLAQEAGIYLPQNLGSFRKNRLQTTGDTRSKIYHYTILSWAALALDAWQMGLLSPNQAEQSLSTVQHSLSNLLPNNPELAELHSLFQAPRPDIANFQAQFAPIWHQHLSEVPDFVATTSPLLAHAQL